MKAELKKKLQCRDCDMPYCDSLCDDLSDDTIDWIMKLANQRVIEELEKLKKNGFTLVDSDSTVKGNYVIAAYRFDEFLEQLKQER
tara:strand:- start:86 stop:343 length:258 start_codon:yes stop_codon:yes gene_type:complete